MWSRFALPLLLGVFAGLWDATVSVWLPGPAASLRAALPLVILSSVFSRPLRAVTVAVAAGVVLDIFQPATGLATLRMLCVVMSIVAVSRLYVTNRSLFGSLVLGAVGFVVDRFFRWMIVWWNTLVGSEVPIEFRPPALPELLWIALCVAAAFWILAAFTRRFLPLVSRR